MLICLFFAAVAVVVSLGTAGGLYSPIKSIQALLRGTKVNERKLKKLLLRKDELGQINEAIREITSVKEQWETSLPELKRHFLYRLAADDSSIRKEIERYADFFSLPLHSCYIVLLGLFEQSPDNGLRAAILKALADCFNERSMTAETTAFFEQNDRFAGFVRFDSMEEVSLDFIEDVKNSSIIFRDQIFAAYELKLTIAVGSIAPGLAHLHDSYRAAANALKYRFVLGTNAIIVSRELEANPADQPVKFDYFSYMKNALDAGRYDQVAQIALELRGYLKSNHYLTEGFVFHYRNIVNMVIRHLQTTHSVNTDYVKEMQQKFMNFEREFASVDEATDWLTGILVKLDAEGGDTRRLHKVVKKAIHIIEHEYAKDPSLADLAARLEVTSTYLSRLFKEELGKNFKEYLTEFKIEQAKRLLEETDLPIETIARQVGYHNHNQFARMFKKSEQLSAMEYRNRIKRPN
jgi:two-component system response regulator YesN